MVLNFQKEVVKLYVEKNALNVTLMAHFNMTHFMAILYIGIHYIGMH